MENGYHQGPVPKRSSRIKKWLGTILAGAVILSVLVFAAFRLSPWPSALLIRQAFDKEAVAVNQALASKVPPGITAIRNQQYDSQDPDAFLDVYFPAPITAYNKKFPVIVWIHGGGWISGNKEQVGNYCKILAGKGYTVVSVDYSIAPGKIYPTPVLQTNNALAYLVKNADLLHVDTAYFVLAGDSGGAHIAAQVANATSERSYAAALGIVPALYRTQLKGVVLFCGPYNTRNIRLDGSFGGFLRTVLWSYSGDKDFLQNKLFATASVGDYVTGAFPPSFISVGNGDPLAPHSQDLARKLHRLQVPVDTLFFAKDYVPAQPHEYQFNLESEAGRLALDRCTAFLSGLRIH